MTTIQLIVLILGALALIALIVGSLIFSGQPWRQCLKCDCWFNELGETSKRAPLVAHIDADGCWHGVCPDCSKNVDYGRE